MQNKIIQFPVKIGRNDPCHCGSGKKYKNCCMRKGEEERLLEAGFTKTETIIDKYFSVREYIGVAGYPVTRFDYFLIEISNISAGCIHFYKTIGNIELKKVIAGTLIKAKDFFEICKKCGHECVKNPGKVMSFQSLLNKGLKLSKFPMVMQKTVGINFFYFEFINVVIHALSEELETLIDGKKVDEITSDIHCALFDFISENCWGGCKNKCMMEYDKSAYCDFCSMTEGVLPCPKKGEIEYSVIKAGISDMAH